MCLDMHLNLIDDTTGRKIPAEIVNVIELFGQEFLIVAFKLNESNETSLSTFEKIGEQIVPVVDQELFNQIFEEFDKKLFDLISSQDFLSD